MAFVYLQREMKARTSELGGWRQVQEYHWEFRKSHIGSLHPGHADGGLIGEEHQERGASAWQPLTVVVAG